MLPYPQIDPVAVAIGPLKIHWYGLMYLIGIGGAWLLASRRLNRFDPTRPARNSPIWCSGCPWGDRRWAPGLCAVL